MPPKGRRKNLVQSRRRTGDDGDDDQSAVLNVGADDSRSEFSASSVDADESDRSNLEHDPTGTATADGQAVNGRSKPPRKRGVKNKRRNDEGQAKHVDPATPFKSTANTEAMMNGLDLADQNQGVESVSYEDTVPAQDSEQGRQISGGGDATAQDADDAAARNEQDSRRLKKGIKPPAVPNKGGYFMHDSRGAVSSAGGGGPAGRRGPAGRGGFANGPATNNAAPPFSQSASKMKWDHDLHDTLLEPSPVEAPKAPQIVGNASSQGARPTVNSLSTSTSIGTVSVRVLLPHMDKPISFERMPVRQHTRLPDLRPPLRRDKPVRVAIPEAPVRYIFPSTERSFIFIPRAQRPGMHSGRARARGGFNQYGSRRNSMYQGGGSIYTPSIARSRRSSQARDGLISPTGSVMSRAPFGAPTGPRPVVKLPTNGQPYDMIGAQFHGVIPGQPVLSLPPNHGYPPAQTALHETHASQIPMHQPRPQKQVSMASIESPDPGGLHAPQQQQQQPFHQQVPSHMSAQPSPYDASSGGIGHSRQQSYSAQTADGTPLSNIPEQAVNAQPFQPNALPPPAFYQPQPYPMFFYPGADGQQEPYNNGSAAQQPPYFAQQPPQGGFFMPMMMMPPPAPGGEDPAGGPGPGMFAHESNGMVYYYHPQMAPAGGEGIPPPGNFSAPGVPPGQDGFYYNGMPQNMMFYPPQ